VQLWPYQVAAVDAVRRAYERRARRILLVIPTGGGKTVTACSVVEGARRKGRKILWLTHRRELVSQASESLRKLGVEHGVILAGVERRPDLPMQVASVQTLTADGEAPEAVNVIIVDEAHHVTANTWKAILRAYPKLELVLGLTATPERGDGTPLGDVFDEMVVACSVAELEALNAQDPEGRVGLVTSVIVAPAKPSKDLTAHPVDAYLEHGGGRRAVVFAAGVEHAVELTAAFNRRGISAECIEGKTDKEIRSGALKRLATGETRIIVNVFCLTEGTDVPSIEVVMIARGCTAWGAWMQMIGRGKRPSPRTGKERCLVIDLRGHVHVHGMPEDERKFSLQGRGSVLTGQPMALRACPTCGCVFRPSRAMGTQRCPRCGGELPKLEMPKVREKPLAQVTAASVIPWERKRATFDDLVREGQRKGWKPKAAAMRFKGLYGHFPPTQWTKGKAAVAS
jgi:DNA repair protein RadD